MSRSMTARGARRGPRHGCSPVRARRRAPAGPAAPGTPRPIISPDAQARDPRPTIPPASRNPF